jgi:hypothetical protein
MNATKSTRVLLVLAALLALAAACSSESGAEGCEADGSCPSEVTEATISPEDSIALAEDDKYVSPPEEFQISQTLRITDAGPVPRLLVVIQNRDMTIRNETSQPQTLHFVNAEVDAQGATTIGPIAPGAQTTYAPPVPISMAYNLDGGTEARAFLQVDVGDFGG